MAKSTCSVSDETSRCDRSAASYGMCDRHYRRWKKTGAPGPVQMGRHQRQGSECAIDECPDPPLARGWCRMHYKRWEAFGDPLGRPDDERHVEGENWLPVPDWEDLYEVSDRGRVWSIRNRFILTASPDEYGYPSVALCRNRTAPDGEQVTTPVHRIEAAAFLGPRPDGMGVCHGDGDCTNNLLSNLRYGTQLENMHDAIEHGTHINVVRSAEVAARPACKNDHEYVDGSFYFNKAGSKICKVCDREKTARYLSKSA